MKFKKFILLIATSLALTSCGFRIGGGSVTPRTSDSNGGNDSEPTQQSYVPAEHNEFSGSVGASGGQVKDPENNLTLDIPAGALENETNITAKYIEAPELISKDIPADFLGGAEFGPDGTEFNEPVTVTINLNKTPKYSELAVYCYYEAEDVWEYVTDATVSGNTASFQVTHFSSYQVQDRTKDFLNEWTNMVRSAKVNGNTDAEILEAFRDYLVNEKHIMDQYTKYNGYWYEPCGLFIAGNYHINGVEGDPNDLIRQEGDENKAGNKYGLCQIDGATSSRMKKDNATETQEIFDVLVVVEYKLIKPDIELTASKKKLNKGETATINIRCHYTNVANFYEEYKDLDLADYFLTVKKPAHFTVSRTSLLTDGSGHASFTVTAKESGQAETITVNFDVPGDFGVHAEGNVTLNVEGEDYIIEGSIYEEIVYTHTMGVADVEDPYTYNPYGTFTITVGYDFSGNFTKTDNGFIAGSLSISNVDVSIESVAAIGHFDSYAAGVLVNYSDSTMILSQILNSVTPSSPTYDFEGELAGDDTCVITSSRGSENIATTDSTGYLHVVATMVVPGLGEEEMANEEENFHTYVDIANPDELLLDFALTNGAATYSSSTFKDKVTVRLDGYGYTLDDLAVTKEGSTTQTITVTRAAATPGE